MMLIERCYLTNESGKLDIIPATISLAGAEIELVSTISREVRMKHAIQEVKSSMIILLSIARLH